MQATTPIRRDAEQLETTVSYFRQRLRELILGYKNVSASQALAEGETLIDDLARIFGALIPVSQALPEGKAELIGFDDPEHHRIGWIGTVELFEEVVWEVYAIPQIGGQPAP
jgi:hypothetical protein